MEEEKKEKRRPGVLPAVLGVLLLAAASAWGGGRLYYENHFLPGTRVDGIDVSGLTVEELEAKIRDYLLCIVERKSDGLTLEEDIQGKEIGLGYTSAEPLREFLKDQKKWMWFLPQEEEYRTKGLISWDQKELEAKVDGLTGFREDFAEMPADAYISEYDPETGFVIVPESQGNELDRQKTPLQFLQLQLAPHFYSNCLKNIYYMRRV